MLGASARLVEAVGPALVGFGDADMARQSVLSGREGSWPVEGTLY